MDIAQKPNKSGQILDQRWIFFCNFYEINSSQVFFCIAKILVLMVSGDWFWKRMFVAEMNLLKKSMRETRENMYVILSGQGACL